MSKKILVACLWLVAILAVVAALTVGVFLTTRVNIDKDSVLEGKSYKIFSAVPTDAVAVLLPEDFGSFAGLYSSKDNAAWFPLASRAHHNLLKFASEVSRMMAADSLNELSSAPAVLSFHYTGDLHPLVVVDAGSASSKPSGEGVSLVSLAESLGLYVSWYSIPGREELPLAGHSVVIASTSEALCKSSQRHLEENSSVVESEGFAAAVGSRKGKDMLYLCGANLGKVFTAAASKKYLKYADFFKSLGAWSVISIDRNTQDRMVLSANVTTDGGEQDFINVFNDCRPSLATVPAMLPYYVSFAASIPSKDISVYADAYRDYADSHVGLGKFLSRQKSLQKSAGIAPSDWLTSLDIREAAVAVFDVAGGPEQFILLKVGTPDAGIIFKGTDVESFDAYDRNVLPFAYAGFASSVLGGLFNIPDQSHFVYINNWIVVGSETGVSAYVKDNVLNHTLADSPLLFAHSDASASRSQAFWAWMAISDNDMMWGRVLAKEFASALSSSLTEGKSTQQITVNAGKEGPEICFSLARGIELPSADELAEGMVIVPAGPFAVHNSGSGKTDQLSCKGGSLTLTEEGETLWTTEFTGSLCGRVCNVDSYANGRIQFAFCSSNRFYIIDRLGNFLKEYPVELEKDVLLGPDVYDFSGRKKYNFMVLNVDNTIDMYNFQGTKPASWNTIMCTEKILGLPELMKNSGKSYWVVRTTAHTYLYSFYGELVGTYEGNVPTSGIQLNS